MRDPSDVRPEQRLSGLWLALLLAGACNGAARAPAAPSSAPRAVPAEPAVEAQAREEEAPKPVEPARKPLPAAQIEEVSEDDPVDPAEIMRSMRHNCCDEAPASEIKAATQSPRR